MSAFSFPPGPFTVLPGTAYNSPRYSEQRVGLRTASYSHLLSVSVPQLPYEDGASVQPSLHATSTTKGTVVTSPWWLNWAHIL